MFTADEVAERLGLHVRTVRAYIRDGRLPAVRIGKQYRIAGSDLAAFTGRTARTSEPVVRQRHVGATSIIEIDAVSRQTVDRLTTLLTTATAHRRDDGDQLRIESIYDEQRAHLKIVVVGGLTTTAHVFGLVGAITEEPEG